MVLCWFERFLLDLSKISILETNRYLDLRVLGINVHERLDVHEVSFESPRSVENLWIVRIVSRLWHLIWPSGRRIKACSTDSCFLIYKNYRIFFGCHYETEYLKKRTTWINYSELILSDLDHLYNEIKLRFWIHIFFMENTN